MKKTRIIKAIALLFFGAVQAQTIDSLELDIVVHEYSHESLISLGAHGSSSAGSIDYSIGQILHHSSEESLHHGVQHIFKGCQDTLACNYDGNVTDDDGSCNYPGFGIDQQVHCDSYKWIDGVTYTESNTTATHTLQTANGCDSIVTLNLTINNSSTDTTSVTECDTYTWDGVAYTTSGVYTNAYTNADGCDSVHTLNLTINNSNTGSSSVEACDTYTWEGQTVTSSQELTHTYTNASGCDSVLTLYVTINLPLSNCDVCENGIYLDQDVDNDGVCNADEIVGCGSLWACNFNSLVTDEDAETCIFPPDGLDCDGNCLSGVAVSAGGGGWPEEVSWSITGCDGNVIVSGGAPFDNCFDVPASYQVSMSDSYGDGWNGNVLTVGNATYTLESGGSAEEDFECNSSGSEEGLSCTQVTVGGGSWQSEVAWSVTGCDGNVIVSGGAPFDNCFDVPANYQVSMFDSYGDGWNGNILTVGNATYTFDDGYSAEEDFECNSSGSEEGLSCAEDQVTCANGECISSNYWCDGAEIYGNATWPVDCSDGSDESECGWTTVNCVEVTVGGGSWQSEVSWEIVDSYGNLIASGGAPYSDCIDLDPEEQFTVEMFDSYGDGWNGNELNISGASFTIESGYYNEINNLFDEITAIFDELPCLPWEDCRVDASINENEEEMSESSLALELSASYDIIKDLLNLTVMGMDDSKALSYDLYDVLGKRLDNNAVNSVNTAIKMESFRPGVYILRVNTLNNATLKTFKIIKN